MQFKVESNWEYFLDSMQESVSDGTEYGYDKVPMASEDHWKELFGQIGQAHHWIEGSLRPFYQASSEGEFIEISEEEFKRSVWSEPSEEGEFREFVMPGSILWESLRKLGVFPRGPSHMVTDENFEGSDDFAVLWHNLLQGLDLSGVSEADLKLLKEAEDWFMETPAFYVRKVG